ncbi:MAG: hypothetical protein GC154_13330 [bacterium]|nr:hypothetical protein [bacterium]
MDWLTRLQRPAQHVKPLTVWPFAPDWGETDVERHLRAIREQGWGGVVIEPACVQSLLSSLHSASIVVTAAHKARELGLSVWLHGGPLSLTSLTAMQLAESEPGFRMQTLEYAGRHDVRSGERVLWTLPEPLNDPLILGITEGGRAMDISQLYRNGRVEGLTPLAVERFWAFERHEYDYTLNPFHPAAVKALIHETASALGEVLHDARTVIDGVYWPRIAWQEFYYTGAPWGEDFSDAFTLMYKKDALESIPGLFDEEDDHSLKHRILYRRAMCTLWRDSYFQPVREAYEALGWKNANLCFLAPPPVPLGAPTLSAPLHAWMEGEAAWGDMSQRNSDTPARLAYFIDNDFLAGFRREVNLAPSLAPRMENDHGEDEAYHEPCQPWMDGVASYAARLSALAEYGTEEVSILMLDAGVTDYARFPFTEAGSQQLVEAKQSWYEMELGLRAERYSLDWMYETQLSCLEVDEEGFYSLRSSDGKQRRYSLILVPPLRLIGKSAAIELTRLADQGGLILFAGRAPDLAAENGDLESGDSYFSPLADELDTVRIRQDGWMDTLKDWVKPLLPDMKEKAVLFARCVQTATERLYLLFAQTDEPQVISTPVETGYSRISEADPATGVCVRSVDRNHAAAIRLQPFGSTLAVMHKSDEAPTPLTPQSHADAIAVKAPFFFFTRNGNQAPLFRWYYEQARDPETEPGERRLEHFYSTVFKLNKRITPLQLKIMGLEHDDLVLLNGQELFFDRWGDPSCAEISQFTQIGDNAIELVRSATWSDARAQFGPVWLEGDFTVKQYNGTDCLTHPRDRIGAVSWTTAGYPYFCGVGVYRQTIDWPEDYANRRSMTCFTEVLHAVELYINEQFAGRRWRAPWRIETTGLFKPGRNLIEFRVANDSFNRFQPEPEPAGVIGPITVEVFERVL